MAYATLQDLIERAGEAEILQVADRDGDGIADAAVVAAAIDAAGVEIDAWLASRYSLPLQPVPAIVLKWAVSLSRYTLHRDGPPDYVVRDQRDAIDGLKAAAAGRLALPAAGTGIAPAQPSTGGISVLSDEPAFTCDRLEGFL